MPEGTHAEGQQAGKRYDAYKEGAAQPVQGKPTEAQAPEQIEYRQHQCDLEVVEQKGFHVVTLLVFNLPDQFLEFSYGYLLVPNQSRDSTQIGVAEEFVYDAGQC